MAPFRRPRRASVLGVPLLALLAACAGDDFARPGTWRPVGANETNLRAMLVDPSHLERGAAATDERGQPASAAVRRLERDRRHPLPDSRASKVGAVLAPTGGQPEGGR